jgi:hypothetical protein
VEDGKQKPIAPKGELFEDFIKEREDTNIKSRPLCSPSGAGGF